jgi:hypothetical protein
MFLMEQFNRRKRKMKTIAANPGWNIVTPRGKRSKHVMEAGLHREPIIAWHLDTDRGHTTVIPITVQGSVSSPDIVYQKPDKTFVQPGLNEWWDDEEGLLMRFEENLETEEEGK